ncbi:unnamed protein product [Mytilus edulis]|uniref:CCHC-type domain-containing protein n=2 Tax=Mytilus TaxID=6548 RepID=A0A8B6H3T1_MYTGA|nr:unnamed protein product [Mytilus edulis]VDI73127.1 Hypothetical predicted protein [Mytilus galloprovincialis]
MDPENPTPLEESPDVSLQDIFRAVKQQGDINSKLRQEFIDLKNEVQGSTLAVASQVKKLKVDNEYHWKYEGNKVQHTLNSEFVEDLNQVIWAIEHCKSDYARETVVDVIDKLKKRNKLIKIADSSEGGWDTVRQYETNPVASDTEDENKITKAENRAIKKRKFKASKKVKSSTNYVNNSAQNVPNIPAKFQQQPFREPQSGWYSGFPLYSNMPSTSGSQPRVQQGACYGCGSNQHWRNRCPFNPKAVGKPKTE